MVSVTPAMDAEEKRARAAELRASGGLAALAAEVAPVTTAADRVLPVPEAFRSLLPDGGLRRGSVVGVEGVGATSLALGLVAEVSATGGWCAAVSVPDLGWLAAQELGVDLARCVVVDADPERWAEAVAALVGAVEVILTRPPERAPTRQVRRLAARLRERGTVIVRLPGPAGVLDAEYGLQGAEGEWVGLAAGRGRLVGRRLRVMPSGRRRRHGTAVDVWLPGADGRLAAVDPTPTPRLTVVDAHA